MISSEKLVLTAAAANVAILLAVITLRVCPSRISRSAETTYLRNIEERQLPFWDLFTSGTGGNGGNGGNGTIPAAPSALKLYWELGYFWQEETIEREWCIACDGGCSEGNKLRTTPCTSTSLPPIQIIINQDTIIPTTVPVDLVQIEVAGAGLCMEAVPEDDVIFLRNCQNFVLSQNQWFYGYNETHVDRFEIRPFVEPDQCVTQLHHPKDGEEIIIQFCDAARTDNTSYWEKY